MKDDVSSSKRNWSVENQSKQLFVDTIRARGPGAVANVLYWIIRAFNLYKECRIEIREAN